MGRRGLRAMLQVWMISCGSVTRLTLGKDLARHLERGHPWIYGSALRSGGGAKPAAGATVDVHDARGAFVARGWFDPDGPIAVRVVTRDPAEPFDAQLVDRRVRAACAVR